jgi:hypothetical protein
MLPAELEEITDPPRDEDELLTADELDTISLFSSLQKGGPDFRRFPSTTILRRCRPGRVICEQGDSGSTAYYILTTEDVLKLRELQRAASRFGGRFRTRREYNCGVENPNELLSKIEAAHLWAYFHKDWLLEMRQRLRPQLPPEYTSLSSRRAAGTRYGWSAVPHVGPPRSWSL